MTEPLSAARLAEIRERARRMIADRVTYAPLQYAEDYGLLLAEVDRLRAELERIQRWAVETVHGSAAAEVLLLIRDLPAASAEQLCDRVKPHPAHKHIARRVSWQCPGIPAAPSV